MKILWSALLLLLLLSLAWLGVNYLASDDLRYALGPFVGAGCHLLGGEFFEDASCRLTPAAAFLGPIWALTVLLAACCLEIVRIILKGVIR